MMAPTATQALRTLSTQGGTQAGAPSPAPPQESRQTVTYIPGLSLESANNTHKKSPKRRKKKTRQESSITNCDSADIYSDNLKSSSPDEIDNLEANFIQHGRAGECVMETPVEPIHEIHLADDLADSLVNPPTDREVFGEEENKLSFLVNSQIASHNGESKEMSIESTNSAEIKAELVNEIIETEIEDKEICEITENIEQMESAEFMKHTSTNKFDLGVKNKETEEPEFIQ